MLNLVNVLNVTCGATGFDIPDAIPNVIHYVILGIEIFIPIILIILGMIDLGRAVMSNDDKTMKEKQNLLIKRIIYAVLIFLVVSIVQVVIGLVATVDTDNNGGITKDNMTQCIKHFVNGTNS